MTRLKPAQRARLGVLASSIAAFMAGTCTGGVAFAQENAEEGASLEEVTVTGTRIRRDDFSSPSPTTVVDSDYLDNLGIVNLSDAIVQVPSNVSTNTPTASPGGNFFNGSTIANLRGLNPFFGSRTLTLIDSRRHVPTNQGDGVDLNFIPTVLIDRMEVVTGGASASYGSGAIAGVTNILLDRDLEGIRAEVDFGTTGESDGDDTHVGFAFGTAIGDSGHFVIGYEGQDMDAINNCSRARDWCGLNVGIDDDNFSIPNPNGQAENVVMQGLHQAWTAQEGLFWLPNYGGRTPNSGTPVPVRLNANGTSLVSYRPGLSGDGFFDGNAVGGDGDPIYWDSTLRSNVDRDSVYASYTRELTDKIGFFVEASAGSVETFSPQNGLNTDYICIRPDYAFADPSITGSTELRDFITANQFAFPCFGGGVPFKKAWRDQANTFNETTTDLTRYAFGFDGQFGDSTWTWDAYYQYGESDRTQTVNDNQHLTRGRFGIDSVIDQDPASATFGQPICRYDANPAFNTGGGDLPFRVDGASRLANPLLAIGCVPINVFGNNTLTPAALDYGWGFLRENTVVEQEIIEFVASGEIADGFGAGPISAAAGVSYRTESIANIAAEELPDYERLDFLIQYGESFGGEVDVTELFFEIDVPFHDKFNLNAAYRDSSYENSAGFGTGVEGDTAKYDISTHTIRATFDPIEMFRIRLSTSKDIRAPNFRELYYGQVFTPGGLFGFIDSSSFNTPAECRDYQTGIAFACNMDPAAWTLAGGLNVTPEEADTDTIGFVIEPPNSTFSFAADYYEIELTNAITPASINLVRDACYIDRDPTACGQINTNLPNRALTFKDPNDPLSGFTDVVTIRAEAFNYRQYKVSGLDLSASYLHEMANGTLAFRVIATNTIEQIIQPSTTNPNLTRDIAGVNGQTNGFLADWASAPDWSANFTTTYARGPFSITGQMRYISEGRQSATWVGPDNPAYAEIVQAPRAPWVTQAGLETVSNNIVPAYALFSATATYNFELSGGSRMSLYGTVNNLFDREPPILGTGVGGTNPILYDTIGRTYRLGLRMSFE